MVTFYRSLLRRLAGWAKRSARRNDHGELPEAMQAYLTKEFKLLPEQMANFGYIRHREGFVRIFDAGKAREQGVAVKKYHDLGKHPELVLFHGRLPKRGTMYLKRAQGVTSTLLRK